MKDTRKHQMGVHSHNFVETYDGIGAFGWDRITDEETIMFYLQKFSDDAFLNLLRKRLSDSELEEIYNFINKFLHKHLTEAEYHAYFLKDEEEKE